MLCSFVSLLFFLLEVSATVTASPLLRVSSNPIPADLEDVPSIYDCLQAASGGDECRAAFDGQCVWCAEPIYGLCVTPSIADKIGMLPIFTCDDHSGKEREDEEEEGVGKSAQAW